MAINRPFEFFVQWHLTENCNLRCRHCYQGERSADEMTLPEIQKVISEVSDMVKDWSESYGVCFSPSMNITGGEPFLRTDLFDILREIKKQGFEIFLLTNGTLVDRERAHLLADLGIKGVQGSMEGPEDGHDAIRGDASYSESAAGVGQWVGAGVKSVIGFASHAGVKRVGFSRLVPAGRGRRLLPHMLTRAQVKELYEALFSLELKGIEVVTGDPVAAQMNVEAAKDAGTTAISGCAAGVAGLTILPNGNVAPCRRLPLFLGNVRRDSLREIWAASPVLEALRERDRYRGKCGACARWARCRGCRAIAYACSRSKGEDDYLADDPQCFIETTS